MVKSGELYDVIADREGDDPVTKVAKFLLRMGVDKDAELAESIDKCKSIMNGVKIRFERIEEEMRQAVSNRTNAAAVA